ncbi:MAG: hypothetical protein LIP09_04340 [Bacteroidales bacterium]|nr:hypothetical protein [Bacteroidales bacterium]
MMLKKILPLLFAAAMMLAGCARHSAEWQRLGVADAVMEERPDSALAILNAIDPAALASPEENARYALLLTQAMSKNYYPISNDSLINIALNYYQEKDNLLEKAKTLFYVGEIAFYLGDNKRAIQFALMSNQIAKNLKNYLWMARAKELMGDIFSKSYNQEEWANAAYGAAKLYEKAGKKRNHDFLMVDYATAISNIGEINRGLYLMDSILQASKKETMDSSLQAYCLRSMFPLLINQKRELEAISCFSKLKEYGDYYSPTPKEYAIVAKAFLTENLDDKAYQMLSYADSLDLSETELAVLNFTKAEYYCKNLDYLKAFLCEREALESQNKIVLEVLRQSLSSVEKDFYNNLSLEEKKQG